MTKGFTLVELSIVLVIIGLIAGGVLVGRDLIRAAEINATISQIRKYEVAVNVFKDKYRCTPGDCPNAATFGLTPAGPGGCAATACNGDLFIDGRSGNANTHSEALGFWQQLSQANLIESGYRGTFAENAVCPPCLPLLPGLDYPATKLGKGGIWVSGPFAVVSGLLPADFDGTFHSTNNSFWLADIAYDTSGNGTTKFNGILTPEENFMIDSKMDDGYPRTGKVTLSTRGSGIPLVNQIIWEDPDLYKDPTDPVDLRTPSCAFKAIAGSPAVYRMASYVDHDWGHCVLQIRDGF